MSPAEVEAVLSALTDRRLQHTLWATSNYPDYDHPFPNVAAHADWLHGLYALPGFGRVADALDTDDVENLERLDWLIDVVELMYRLLVSGADIRMIAAVTERAEQNWIEAQEHLKTARDLMPGNSPVILGALDRARLSGPDYQNDHLPHLPYGVLDYADLGSRKGKAAESESGSARAWFARLLYPLIPRGTLNPFAAIRDILVYLGFDDTESVNVRSAIKQAGKLALAHPYLIWPRAKS